MFAKTLLGVVLGFIALHMLAPTYHMGYRMEGYPALTSAQIAALVSYHRLDLQSADTACSRWLNPSRATYTQLVRFGMLPATAYQVVQYTESGQIFAHRDEFRRFVMSDPQFYYTSSQRVDLPYPMKHSPPSRPFPGERFQFDPNSAAREAFVRLGFSPKQADVILHYRAKGGVFRVKEDFKKIFVVSEERYECLAPYITLPERLEGPCGRRRGAKPLDRGFRPFPFDPNTITPDSLLLLGFTKQQAKTILNYRTSLGGFRYKEDFRRCYPVDSAIYALLAPFIALPERFEGEEATASPKPTLEIRDLLFSFNPNTVTVEELVQFGVAPWRAKGIVNYRERGGRFSKPADLQRLKVVDSVTFQRMVPHLKFD